MVRVSTSICKIAVAAFTLVTAVNAQSPTQTWNIAQATSAVTNAGCVLGLANQADPNGFYDDPWGARYAIRCQQNSNGFSYDNVGTTGQGAYACSKGCDNRPSCRGWHYEGIQSSGTTGTGRCYYRITVGQFSSNANVYAGAELLSNGTPRLPCPYYNNTIFTDTQNYQWRIRCGFDTQASDTGTALTSGSYNMTDCMRGCNSFLNDPNPCTIFSYAGQGQAVPADGQIGGGGNCYYKYGTSTEVGDGNAAAAYAVRMANTPVSPSAASATTLSTLSSSALAATTPVSSSAVPATTLSTLSSSAVVVTTPVSSSAVPATTLSTQSSSVSVTPSASSSIPASGTGQVCAGLFFRGPVKWCGGSA